MTELSELKKGQSERLFFVEFVLLFMGQLQRTRLSERFGISSAAATKDLSLYAELNPNFCTYDFRQKCYCYEDGSASLWSHKVEPSFYTLSAHLPISRAVANNSLITSSVGESIKRKVEVHLASSITRCIYQHKTMSVTYRSMRSGERQKVISPLAIIHDGLRWHIRGYDHDDKIYKDYTLARFLSAKEGVTSTANLSEDPEWTKDVELVLEVHPRADYPETVVLDYDMEDGEKTITMKSCMVGYLLRRWPIDYSEDASGNPNEKHLHLKNRKYLLEAGVSKWAFGE